MHKHISFVFRGLTPTEILEQKDLLAEKLGVEFAQNFNPHSGFEFSDPSGKFTFKQIFELIDPRKVYETCYTLTTKNGCDLGNSISFVKNQSFFFHFRFLEKHSEDEIQEIIKDVDNYAAVLY